MTSRFVRTSLACLLLLALASPSFAARRSSLAGNLLIQDVDDIFIYPQLVSMHKRLVTFDLGTNSGLGSGGMVFGNEQLTLGAFTHRSDFLGAVPTAFFTRGDIDNIGNNGRVTFPGFISDLNWIDVLAGWQLGDNPWGARLSVGRNSNNPEGTATQDITSLNLVLGARLNQWNTDVSGEFSYATANDEASTGAKDEATPVEFAISARRTPAEDSDALVLGWLGMFDYFTASVDNTPAGGGSGTTQDHSGFDAVAGVGPVYRPNDRTNIAMYGTFEWNYSKDDVTGGEQTSNSIVIPGWHIAGEFDLASWIQFRAGLVSRFYFNSSKLEPTTPPSTEDKSNDLEFDWTSGVGLHFSNFQFDGYLDPTVLTNGTSLFGHNTNNLFGMVTASYTF